MLHHGWQPALMTSLMWLANVTGEFLYRLGEDVTVIPGRVPPRMVDDPLGTLEEAIGDLKLAFTAKDLSAMLRQLTVLIYYAVQMTTNLQLHPYLSSAFLWVHEWQMSKICDDFAPAESTYEMLQNVTMKEVRNGYVNVAADARVVGEDSLEDKTDIVLTIPVENLLMLVPTRLTCPMLACVERGINP